MNTRWIEMRRGGDFSSLASILGVSPITAKIMRNRGLETAEEMESYLNADLSMCHSHNLFKGMKILTGIMEKKICENKKIRIIGDYDVDGVTATFILYRGLKYLGADCDYRIPHRVEDGYGINIRLIDEAHEDGIDTIITCDNGISAIEQTKHANELGMTMVITDHHEVPFETVDGNKAYILPDADAIVDPKLPGETYPFQGICGAVVAMKVIDALAEAMKRDSEPAFVELKKELLEASSLATVCDVMEIKDENRAIVKHGLELMENSSNKGLKALIRATGIEGKKLSPYHCGFVLGPALNATGRLDSSLKALGLLLCDEESKAAEIAEELKAINEERKELTLRQTEYAISLLEEKESIDKVIVLFLPECHESLAGIIAGRIRERYAHPCFVLTRTENGLKGSGRSIENYDMYEKLTEVSSCLNKFGGHKMAAGISLDEDRLEEFVNELNERCNLREEDFQNVVRVDMAMTFNYVNLALCHELEKLEPCGTGNERPIFANLSVTFLSGQPMGRNNNAARYRVSDGTGIYNLTYFGDLSAVEDYVREIYGEEKARLLHSGMNVNIKLDICYQASVNVFRGEESAQITMKYYR